MRLVWVNFKRYRLCLRAFKRRIRTCRGKCFDLLNREMRLKLSCISRNRLQEPDP